MLWQWRQRSLKKIMVGLKEITAKEHLGKTHKLEMLERLAWKVLAKAQKLGTGDSQYSLEKQSMTRPEQPVYPTRQARLVLVPLHPTSTMSLGTALSFSAALPWELPHLWNEGVEQGLLPRWTFCESIFSGDQTPCTLNEHFWLRVRPLLMFLNFLFICVRFFPPLLFCRVDPFYLKIHLLKHPQEAKI